MNENYRPEIPCNSARDNSAPTPTFGVNAIRELCIQAQTPLKAASIQLSPAPVRRPDANSGPPKEPEPGEEPTLPTLRKALPPALELLRSTLLSESFIDVVADAVVEKLLAEQAQGAEAIDSIESIQSEVMCSLYFVQESGGPAYAHFDSDAQFDHALRVALNLGNRNMNAYVSGGEIHSVKYLCGKAIAQLVLRQQQTPFEAAIRAALLTTAGRAPNARITEERFAVALAQSSLLARLQELPIYGNARLVDGRSFHLGKFKVFTPRADLGSPWNRPEGQR
jgi:hypothetical protein